ncbi:MAG: insulinase family protein [Candidatus Bipolaricaulota bacterium]|nr:insulinase family protein [Candidatus Bipolaricaulota bacterium]
MKRSLVIGLLLTVLVAWSFPLAQPNVQEFTLENGLKVLIVPKPGTGITTVDIWINVGSLNETREISGISHFFEHMLFKGTEKRPGGIDREIEALGGRTNAATSYDFTHYYIILPSEHTELALDIIADITQNSSFPEEEIAREKEVVLREQDQRTDDPGSFAFFTMRQDFYTVHPYKLPIIGFADSLEKLTREDFLQWMRTYYVPNNMTLVVAGDIETEKTLQIVREKFGAMQPKEIPTQTYPKEPARTQKIVREIERDVRQGYLIFAWPGPSVKEARDVYAMDVLITLLSEGRSSRFYKKLKKELGLVTTIDAGYFTQKEPGIFNIYAEFPYENRAAVEQTILSELQDILDGKLSSDEVERAKTVLLAREAFQAETAAGLAGTLGFYSVVAGDYTFALTYPEKIRTVTVQDIIAVARKYINLDAYYQLVLIPESAAEPKTAEELATLPNGLKLVLREDHSAGTVALQAFVGTGERAEPAELAGVAELTSRLLLRGTTTRSEEEIFTQIEGLGAQLSQDVLADMAYVTLVAPKETLERALPLYLDVLLNPAFAPDEVERTKTEFIREIRAQADQNFSVIYNNFQSALYGAHAYGRFPTPESVARITRDDIVQFYKRYYVPNNMTIVAVGAFDRALLEALLRAKLQELPTGAEDLPIKPRPSALALTENKRVEATKRANLSWIILGYPAPPVASPDYPAMKLLNAILGGGMSSRLFSELRDKRGLAYSTGSFYPSRAEESHFVTYIIALPDNAATAQQGILEIIKDIQENGVPQDELERAKSYVIGNYRIDHETAERRAWYLGWYETLGVGYQMDARYPELIQAVTSEDIQRVAQKYLQYYVLSVLGPGS